jgi:hypothetical protein
MRTIGLLIWHAIRLRSINRAVFVVDFILAERSQRDA